MLIFSSGILGLCKLKDIGTKDTRAANNQMIIMVVTATRRVTHRPYLKPEPEDRIRAKLFYITLVSNIWLQLTLCIEQVWRKISVPNQYKFVVNKKTFQNAYIKNPCFVSYLYFAHITG